MGGLGEQLESAVRHGPWAGDEAVLGAMEGDRDTVLPDRVSLSAFRTVRGVDSQPNRKHADRMDSAGWRCRPHPGKVQRF